MSEPSGIRRAVVDSSAVFQPPWSKVGGTPTVCSHIDSIQYFDLPAEVAGCEECLRQGTEWVHLRMCQTCGHVGCCDDSPATHATAHHRATGHPLVRSAEPGEDWSWCYVDEAMFRLSRG